MKSQRHRIRCIARASFLNPLYLKTLLSRLAAKAVVGTERDGRRFLYSPLVERDDYLTGVSRNFVDRLFGGKVMPLVAHLAEADELSADDIREIEELLRELKK